ncbi:hypothetical protein A3B56_02760 [Candidatus Roizmanbacteria bacterium RIFCSPLOWO2_01_FULL_45_11]|uniref:DUF2029 domain-containing protein n=1 Tax=Candidatus Roizmanbacteria bacterium RIFCSPLOWO2_01_FULL_45_11 TaxID=1802070 RepID=A0A1F7JHV6_9BACT|nr:MAG: hypothetical protein A3B56_02760 [Candidatus Roizmanbacteria bacterium RIFCSPLOWO2_01_FULL_45_11]
MRILNSVYLVLLLVLTIFSYGFVDPNFPVSPPPFLHQLVYTYRPVATGIYVGIMTALFALFALVVKRTMAGHIQAPEIWRLVFITTAFLFVSFPAFSYDVFNYIATARVLFTYGENPYVVMPVELSHEPMLAFMHASNKTALYGISWIVLSSIPHAVSFGSIVAAVYAFKGFVAFFYLGLCYLIWLLSKKNPVSLVLFALHPLVVIETLVSSHQDVVMMFFALLSFYLIKKHLPILAGFSLLISIGIKFATVALLPVFGYVLYLSLREKKIPWETVWIGSTVAMTLMVIVSPLREEVYAWYLIWPLTFTALLPSRTTLHYVYAASGYGLLLRFAPFILTRNWFGTTPMIKYVVTAAPLALVSLWRLIYRK